MVGNKPNGHEGRNEIGQSIESTQALAGHSLPYRRQLGAVSVAVSLLTIIWTTIVLTWVKSNLVADDVEDLALAYVLPTIVIAIFFDSTLAVASSFVSALAAAYFIYPPAFTFYIADPLHIAELGFIVLLSLTASKAVGVITEDRTPKAYDGILPPLGSSAGICTERDGITRR